MEMRREGATLQTITNALNEAGTRGQRGGRWTPTSVRRVLVRAGLADRGS